MQKLQRLEHDPLGLEHPYQAGPAERSPRQPLAGAPVTLGAATWPAGAAKRVWAEWTCTGSDTISQAEGQPDEQEGERSLWQVVLPPFPPLAQVKYRLAAADNEQVLRSPEYSFTAAAWQPAGPHAAVELQPGRVALSWAGPGELVTRLALGFTNPQRLRLAWQAWRAGSPPPPLPGGGTGYQVIHQDVNSLMLQSGNLRLAFNFAPFELFINPVDGGQAVLAAQGIPEWLVGEGGRLLKLRQGFTCQEDEGFYGFGERFNALNQRGRRLDVCVFEQYKSQGQLTYIPVPFCFSSRGWGLYLDTARRVVYDLAAEQPGRWSFEAGLGSQCSLEADLFTGQPLELVRAFSEITGKPKLPPAWAFGPWMSSNEWNTQAEVERQVRLTTQHGIPATVLVIEAWSDEATFYIWNGAEYDPRPGGEAFRYSDLTFSPGGPWQNPKAMIENLHRRGIRLVLWQIPVLKRMEIDKQAGSGGPPGPVDTLRIAQHDLDEAHMLEQGYHLHYASGEPYRVRPFWFRDSLLLDFTNPQAADWWMSKRAYLLDDLGVDGFKTDGGEHLWGEQVRFHDGRRGDEGVNLYPNLYVGAYHRFTSQKRAGDALTFSRAGFTGAQAFPCHWAGDENSTFEAFRASLLAGLNAGLSGIPFWGWDIGGFSGEVPGAELYLRSAAMAAFCPIMQYHSEYNHHRQPNRDRTPWNIAERSGRPEVIEIYRQLALLRMRLLPYIEAEAYHCAESGEPLMRPLFLDWPDDPVAWQICDQYCFGRALLVAPVLQPGATERRVYLPEGQWIDFWDGTPQAGGRWINVPAPLERIPVFQRPGTDWPGLGE